VSSRSAWTERPSLTLDRSGSWGFCRRPEASRKPCVESRAKRNDGGKVGSVHRSPWHPAARGVAWSGIRSVTQSTGRRHPRPASPTGARNLTPLIEWPGTTSNGCAGTRRARGSRSRRIRSARAGTSTVGGEGTTIGRSSSRCWRTGSRCSTVCGDEPSGDSIHSMSRRRSRR